MCLGRNYDEIIVKSYDEIVACSSHKKFRPCLECGEMPWAICEWCERVVGVMWDSTDDVVECRVCGAWLSVEGRFTPEEK